MKPRTLFLIVGLCLVTGCDSGSSFLTRSLLDLSLASQDLYAIPYPNDIRLKDDGSINLAGYENGQPDLVQLYLKTVAENRLAGFGLGSAIYLRFRDEIDPASCGPRSANEDLAPGASVFLVNIGRGSPGYAERVPLRWKYVAQKQPFIGAHSLTLLPLPGFALAPGTTYAAVVTEAMCDPFGDPVQPGEADLQLALDNFAQSDPTLRRAHDAYAPLRAFMADTGLTGVVTAAVFTTGRPTEAAGLARRRRCSRSPRPRPAT